MSGFPRLISNHLALNSKSLIRVFIILIFIPFFNLAFSQNVGVGTLTPEDPLHLIGRMRISGAGIYFVNTGQSVFLGENAGAADDLSENRNVFIGYNAGSANTSGSFNIGLGHGALDSSAASSSNIAIGSDALGSVNYSGIENIAIGREAQTATTIGVRNIALGQYSLRNNTIGSDNISIGYTSMDYNTTGISNTAIGSLAFSENIAGNLNAVFGAASGHYATGSWNTFLGAYSGIQNTGSGNTFLGFYTGHNNATGSNNVFIGHRSGFNETGSNKLYISNTDTSDPLVYGDFSLKKLSINDTLSTKSFYLTEGGTNGYILNSNSSGKASWVDPSSISLGPWTTSGTDIYQNNLGNVGIGTTSPSQKLEIDGNIEVSTGRILFSNIASGIYIGTAAGENDINSFRNNIFIGHNSGVANSSGQINTALGNYALTSNTTGNFNTAIGGSAMQSGTGGSNVAVGFNAGLLASGNQNTFLGNNSGFLNTGSRNIFLGYDAGKNETGSDKLYVDNSDTSTPLLYGEFDKNKVTVNDSLITQCLGIGTSTPSEKLEVVGNIKVNAGRIEFINTGNSVFMGEDAGIADNLTDNENTFIGYQTAKTNITGDENTAIGAEAMLLNSWGFRNVAVGNEAMKSIVGGGHNVVIGYQSGKVGDYHRNTIVGALAGLNTGGGDNVFLGYGAGENEAGSNKLYISNSNTTTPLLYGEFDKKRLTVNDTLITKNFRLNSGKLSFVNTGQSVFIGEAAGAVDDLTDNNNVLIGYHAGDVNTTGYDNIAIGTEALGSNVSGFTNVAIGDSALSSNTLGFLNIAIGKKALNSGGFSIGNVAVGNLALSISNGVSNVAVGGSAGVNATGSGNTFIGSSTGANNTGSNNVFIGADAGANSGSQSDKLIIDNSNTATPLISGDFVNNNVGINVASPTSNLVVAGSFASTMKNSQVLGTNDPDETAMVWRYTSNGGNNTIDLPAAISCPGRIYILLNQTVNTYNISPYTNLSGNSNSTISSSASLMLMSDGTGWFQIK